MNAKIRFSVEGSITQTLFILNGESAESIAEKLGTGEYVTSVAGDRYIIRTEQIGNADSEKIAIILDSDLDTEYTNFEVEE